MTRTGTSRARAPEAQQPRPRALPGAPRPFLRQLILLVPVVVDLAVTILAGQTATFGREYVTGVCFLGALALAALGGGISARKRGDASLMVPLSVALLVGDLAAIGLLRLVPGGSGIGALAVLPAMWLGADLRLRGVALSLTATTLLVSAPSLVYLGNDTLWWSRALVLPTVATLCSLTVARTGSVWSRQNQELERQGRLVEEALLQATTQRALNEAIISTVDVGLLAIDDDGTFTAVNPRQVEFLRLAYPDGPPNQVGRDDGAVFGADRVTRLAPHELPEVRALRGESIADVVVWVGESRQEQRALSVSAGPVVDAAGTFRGAVLVSKDVTDLVAALKVKDDFVASVSHELRTPLTSIMGYLDLVLDDEQSVSPGVRRRLEVAKRNSVRLLRLVGDLLSTAQADEGRLSLDLDQVDLAAMLDQALTEHGPHAQEKQVSLERELPATMVIRADPVRLRQLVDNLISNAIKYTQAGGGVTVGLERLHLDVVLVVRDTGIGISTEHLPLVFTRFFRTPDVESRAIQGIGLGLAITKSIVDAHEGQIKVTSNFGRGSTFVVHLPVSGPGPRALWSLGEDDLADAG